MTNQDIVSEPVGQPFTVTHTMPLELEGDAEILTKLNIVFAMEIGRGLSRLSDGREYYVKALPVARSKVYGISALKRTVIVTLRDWRECEVGEYALCDAISDDEWWGWDDRGRQRTHHGFAFAYEVVGDISLFKRIE
jgi:hypothetical protein